MDANGWEDFDAPVLYFYAGLMPYTNRYVILPTLSSAAPWSSPVFRDMLQWLLALPNGGSTDIAIQETAPLSSGVGRMDVAHMAVSIGPRW